MFGEIPLLEFLFIDSSASLNFYAQFQPTKQPPPMLPAHSVGRIARWASRTWNVTYKKKISAMQRWDSKLWKHTSNLIFKKKIRLIKWSNNSSSHFQIKPVESIFILTCFCRHVVQHFVWKPKVLRCMWPGTWSWLRHSWRLHLCVTGKGMIGSPPRGGEKFDGGEDWKHHP